MIEMPANCKLSRDVPIIPRETALLVVDVQNLCAKRDGGEFRDRPDRKTSEAFSEYFERIEQAVIPKIQVLLSSFRNSGTEVMFATIESLTSDGRDRSLDYKISGFNVSKGSWDAKVVDEVRPEDDEIVFPKSSSSVFISTNIDYVLRNLGVRQLVVCGLRTDGCVESAVRDAATFHRLTRPSRLTKESPLTWPRFPRKRSYTRLCKSPS